MPVLERRVCPTPVIVPTMVLAPYLSLLIKFTAPGTDEPKLAVPLKQSNVTSAVGEKFTPVRLIVCAVMITGPYSVKSTVLSVTYPPLPVDVKLTVPGVTALLERCNAVPLPSSRMPSPEFKVSTDVER